RFRHVVEADDREVVGNAEVERAGDGDRLERSDVVRGEDRGRRRVDLEQLARRLGRGGGLVAALLDEALVHLDPGGTKCFPVSALAQACGLEIVASAEEADSPMPEPQKVL